MEWKEVTPTNQQKVQETPMTHQETVQLEPQRRPGLRWVVFGFLVAFAGIIAYQLGRSQLVEGAENTDAYVVIRTGGFLTLLAAPIILLGFAFMARRRIGLALAWFGAIICVVGAALWAYFYPFQFNLPPGNEQDRTYVVLNTYAFGILLLIAAQFFASTLVVRRRRVFQRRIIPLRTARVAPAPPAPARPQFSGQIWPVEMVEGIGPAYAERLHRANVHTTADLMNADAPDLAESADISEGLILTWQSQGDLSRLPSVVHNDAELLVRSGVYSVNQLSWEPTDQVQQRLRSYVSTTSRPPQRFPEESLVGTWGDEAAQHTLPFAYPWMLPRGPEAPAQPRPMFRGEIIPVTEIQGIGPVYARRLENAGIRDSLQLLSANPEDLGEKAGVSPSIVRQWQAMADLDRLSSVNNQHAELLARAGILSVTQLARERPGEILEKIESYLKEVERAPTTEPVDLELTRLWVDEASKLSHERLVRPARVEAPPEPTAAAGGD